MEFEQDSKSFRSESISDARHNEMARNNGPLMEPVSNCDRSIVNGDLSRSLNIAKVIFLSGVIMIHCDPSRLYTGNHADVLNFFKSLYPLLSLCVPGFFIISGYLFFFNVEHFDFYTYKDKMQSRLHSLLIPYLLWCTFYGISRYFKSKYLGFDGDGIVVDGSFSIVGFIKGYWATPDGYPMGFVMWFIRNLLVFQLLSPVIYFLGKNYVLAVVFLILPLLGVDMKGAEFFLFGSMLGIHKINLVKILKKHVIFLTFIFIVFTEMTYLLFSQFMPLVQYVGIFFVMALARICGERMKLLLQYINGNSNSFFFIYAVHGMYSTIIVKFCYNLLDCNEGGIFLGALCFLMSFLLNLMISTMFFVTLRHFMPNFLNILSGGRFKTYIV